MQRIRSDGPGGFLFLRRERTHPVLPVGDPGFRGAILVECPLP